MRATVVCSMRNEGAFLLEWVCWYRMLGFTDILVVTNDCSDHSPALLQALAAAGWLHHLDCAVL
ncbi:MAG: glycosyltransferase family 2 protein, partial [Gemmobacter sp.]